MGPTCWVDGPERWGRVSSSGMLSGLSVSRLGISLPHHPAQTALLLLLGRKLPGCVPCPSLKNNMTGFLRYTNMPHKTNAQ